MTCPTRPVTTSRGVEERDARLEPMAQDAEDRAWTCLRALAQEHGMADPSTLPDLQQQLLWMGIKAGIASGIEIVRGQA